MSAERTAEFEQAIRDGGVVVFPSDTVYGLAVDPGNADAIERLYALKQRPAEKSAAVMFFNLHAALHALPELGERTRKALHGLLPGPVTVLLPNPEHRYPLACRADPETLGVRVVEVPVLHGADVAVLQSSANPSGAADAQTLAAVAPAMRAGANLVIDGGELPGKPSTVIDMRGFEADGSWAIVREGLMSAELVTALLTNAYRFKAETYASDVTDHVHDYEEFQVAMAAASGGAVPVRRILELGPGTGATTRLLLDAHPEASVVGLDGSDSMLAAAAAVLPAGRFEGVLGLFESPLPEGPFELVASALAIHHLDDAGKLELFTRVRAVLVDGGRFVLGDVIKPERPEDAVLEISEGFDKPSTLAQQLAWMRDAGFTATVAWQRQDLVVISAE